MRILIACESSGVVRRAFRERGHDAWSCDILPADDGSEHHLQCDVLTVLNQGWNMMIAFPPCTDLCVSGAKHFRWKRQSGKQAKSIAFFMALANAPIPKIAIENPIGIISTVWRRPNQIIQPWQHGHGETKATCLWLKNLPRIRPTCFVKGRQQRIWKMPPSEDRWKLRSETYPGIAKAFAKFWG